MNRLAILSLVLAASAVWPAYAAESKPKKPRLDLRATPRMAFSPVRILLTAELSGGSDVEDYYCPELEWDWDDGGKSVHEADCKPFEPGVTKIERRFTSDHHYSKAGVYNVRVTMRRTNRPIATSSVRITVRPGLGDPSTMEN
jgi:hypothetical protein